MFDVDVRNLTLSELYDVATAIRGPDVSHPIALELKEMFTARIRYWCFGYNAWGDTRHKETRWGDIVRLMTIIRDYIAATGERELDGIYANAFQHYLSHVYDALRVIQISLAASKGIESEAGMLKEIAGVLCNWAGENFNLDYFDRVCAKLKSIYESYHWEVKDE